ncbi:MAG: ABC transporter permease subunit [Candidatus Methanosuratincola petrocarbonis]
MRFSKAWLVSSRDFRIFRHQKNIWYSIIIFPVLISVLFPTILEYAGQRSTGLLSVANLPNLLDSFSFFIVIGAAYIPLGIASYSIVGEKIEKSLEPLLATPLTDGEILLGKAIAALLPTLVAMYAGAAVFMVGIDAVTFGKLGYNYFPNWTLGVLLIVVVPAAVVMSVLYSIIVSSRVNDVRSANGYGILIFIPFLAIYFTSEIRIISLDINGLLIIASILSAIDAALYFVSTAAFQREEILTKWK